MENEPGWALNAAAIRPIESRLPSVNGVDPINDFLSLSMFARLSSGPIASCSSFSPKPSSSGFSNKVVAHSIVGGFVSLWPLFRIELDASRLGLPPPANEAIAAFMARLVSLLKVDRISGSGVDNDARASSENETRLSNE